MRVKPSGKSKPDLIVVVRVFYGKTLLSEQGFIFPSKGMDSSSYASITSPIPFGALPSRLPASVHFFEWGLSRNFAIPVKYSAEKNVPLFYQAKQLRFSIKFKEV